MSDLTDFLLARIAEDEEQATNVQNWQTSQPPKQGSWIVMPHETEGPFDPERILAECEAKRTLLTFAAAVDTDMQHLVATEWRVTVLNSTARILARPYANHPDYRDDWSL